jgi:hypothetical protein
MYCPLSVVYGYTKFLIRREARFSRGDLWNPTEVEKNQTAQWKRRKSTERKMKMSSFSVESIVEWGEPLERKAQDHSGRMCLRSALRSTPLSQAIRETNDTAANCPALFVSHIAPTATPQDQRFLKASGQSRPLWEELPVQLGMCLMTRECLTRYTRDSGCS